MKSIHKNITRILSFVLVLITVFGVVAVPLSVSAANHAYFPAYIGTSSSIVTALSAVGVSDTSFSNRTKIAQANGVYDYRGTSEQNLKLVSLLKAGRLINPSGKVPNNSNIVTNVPSSSGSTVYGSVSSVMVTTSGFKKANSSVKIRKSKSTWAATYATLEKGAIIKPTSTSGDYYVVKLGGTSYYIKKSDVSNAPSSVNANLYYSTKNAPLRSGPAESASTVATIPTSAVIGVVGKVKNSAGNTWVIANYNGKWGYIYSGNVKAVSKIELKVTGINKIMQGNTAQFSYTVNPKVSVTWYSSNTSIAKVTTTGKVTGVSAGTCEIRATVNGVVTVSYKLTVVNYASQIRNAYSSSLKMTGRNSFNGFCGLYAGCMVKALGITKEGNFHNGNDQYDVYKNMSYTSGGYRVITYPGTKYNLRNALNALTNNGTTNVENILVGYHTGSGTAGRLYGHAVFIHAIVNGKVHFSESFSGNIVGRYYTEGTPIVCSIDQFASYYGSWCSFEGIIHFYK
jgi:hypothetical protein